MISLDKILSLSLLTLTLSSCGGGNGSSSSVPDEAALDTPETDTSSTTKTVQVNATAGGFSASADDPDNKYTYINLDTGQLIALSDVEAITSTDWHLGFKRTSIIANGGISGTGDVSVALADAQEDYYNSDGSPNTSVFMNASAERELDDFDTLSRDENLTFHTDNNQAFIDSSGGDDSWYTYDFVTHQLSANNDNWYVIKSAEGDSYAKFHVTSMDTTNRDVTVQFVTQQQGQSSFDNAVTWVADVSLAGGSACFDIETSGTVDCAAASENWDLQLEVSASGRSWTFWTNGGVKGSGVNGAAFGPLSSSTEASYISGNLIPNYFSDSSGGVFSDESFYAYNLGGQHKLWPNYKVYAVNTGSEVYKLQILSYYDPNAGTSGVYTLRYKAY